MWYFDMQIIAKYENKNTKYQMTEINIQLCDAAFCKCTLVKTM